MEETDNIRKRGRRRASFVLVYTQWRRAERGFYLEGHSRMIVLLVVLAFFFIVNQYTCMQGCVRSTGCNNN